VRKSGKPDLRGSLQSVAVPDQGCTAISAVTRVFDALWRCTASGTRDMRGLCATLD